MPVPVVADVQTDTAKNGADLVFTKPTGLAVGDLMIYGSQAWDMIQDLPSGWTSIDVASRNGVEMEAFWKIADSDDVAASTFTFSFGFAASPDSACGCLYRITGHDGADPIDVADIGTGSSSTQTSVSVTTTNDDALIVRMVGVSDNVTITVPGGITEDYVLFVNDTNPTGFAGGHETQASAGSTGTEDFTTSGTEEYGAITIAINAGAGPANNGPGLRVMGGG